MKNIKEYSFSLDQNDLEKVSENGNTLVSAYKRAISKYKGCDYSRFNKYITPYIYPNEKILSKYYVAEHTRVLAEEEEEQKNTIIDLMVEIDGDVFNLDGYSEFMDSLVIKNENEKKSFKKIKLKNDNIEDIEDVEGEIIFNNSILEDRYYINIESYFKNLDVNIEFELSELLSESDKESYLYQYNLKGDKYYQSNYNLFSNIKNYSENKYARNISSEILKNICRETDDYYNGHIVQKILKNRLELSQNQKKENFFQYRESEREIRCEDEVDRLLNECLSLVKPKAKEELETLRIFIKNEFNVDNLRIEDIAYYSDKYKKKKYEEIDFDINNYFTVESIIQAGLELAEDVFKVRFVKNNNAINDNNILCYDLLIKNKKVLTVFLDLYEREEKQISGFTSDILHHSSCNDGVIYISCHLSQELKLPDIENYLHELGHCIHSALLNTDVFDVYENCTINKDLIEIPSLTFEKFLFNKKLYKNVKEVNEDKLCDAFKIYNFFSSYQTCIQIAYSFYDLKIHSLKKEISLEDLEEMFEDIIKKCIPAGMHEYENCIYSFEHIFSNGYESIYYGYVLSDLYASLFYSLLIEDPSFISDFSENFLGTNNNEAISAFLKKHKGKTSEKFLGYYNI